MDIGIFLLHGRQLTIGGMLSRQQMLAFLSVSVELRTSIRLRRMALYKYVLID